MMNKFHPYHMVTPSPWPAVSSIISSSLMAKAATNMSSTLSMMEMTMMTLLTSTSAKWWKDTNKEAAKEGNHHTLTIKGLKMGMVLFIASEVLFFSSFFWAYFHSSISPTMSMGNQWPPKSIEAFDPTNVPLLNTVILISSGMSVTWAHHSILKGMKKKAFMALLITCLLGVYFSLMQAMEYMQAQFSMSDSVYGSTFYLATGFHGIHVLIGTIFLTTNLFLIHKSSQSMTHHVGFEMAAWYWHFVDIVWLFLYISIYWWGK